MLTSQCLIPKLEKGERPHTSVQQETAALRDFDLAYVGFGSSRVKPKRFRLSRHVRFTPQSGHCELVLNS
jgi:hypothetical protein